ncbi:hypothetical protein VNO78_20569 [Psophocarpus tetragonolobus]|uniref:Uncharacterized protein n=1 Tax=Psophocarpus tetragonolobus TaxID=3891 RepID=A0AAN9XH98_PSOTE
MYLKFGAIIQRDLKQDLLLELLTKLWIQNEPCQSLCPLYFTWTKKKQHPSLYESIFFLFQIKKIRGLSIEGPLCSVHKWAAGRFQRWGDMRRGTSSINKEVLYKLRS